MAWKRAIKYAPYAGALARGFASYYNARYSGKRSALSSGKRTRGRYRVKSRRRRRTRESDPLTGQYDYKQDYGKKRETRRSRGYRRFSRKITKIVRNDMVGTTHIVRRAIATLVTGVNISDAVCFGLNGMNGISGDTFNPTSDLGNIMYEMDRTSWDNVDTSTLQTKNQRLYVHSCTMEMTLRNTADVDALVEAYFIRGRTRYVRGNVADSPVGLYFSGFNNQGLAENPDGSGTFPDNQLAASTIGVTPWQNQRFCQNYTIVKRIKFRIPPGAEVNHVIQGPSGVYRDSYVKNTITDRKYYGILYQQQGSPARNSGIDVQAQSCQVTYLSVRRYRVKMLANNLAMDAFDASNNLRTVTV